MTLSARILQVDLTSSEIERFDIGPEDVRAYLGGASLAARLLFPELERDLDPLSPEAPLLLMTGPLTGTSGPAVGRFVICAKSPATMLWGEANAGGFFGPEMKSAGLDGLLIRGKAPRPSYIWIHDGQVEIRDATRLWGRADTYETQAELRDELGDRSIRVASIGLAGENGIPFALVLCDHGRVAGRTGMGAVMGAKKLKAVAVRGHAPIPLVSAEAFRKARTDANIELRGDNISRAMRQFGTAANGDYFDYLGEMPKHYFTRGTSPTAPDVSGVSVAETILSGVSACHACVIACGRKVRLQDGVERKGPEYETLVGFGPNLEIGDTSAITRLGEMCDRFGLDSISMSGTIGLALLLFQEGRIPPADVEGHRLEWGNASEIGRLIEATAHRKGFGGTLAAGARALAAHYGAPGRAAQVNGLEVPYHDPRGASGMALVYATSPRGACHNQGDYFLVDTMGQSFEEVGVTLHPRHAAGEKAASVARHQDWRTLGNSLVLCHFANVAADALLNLVNLATGFDYSLAELMAVGERGWNLKRLVNRRLGLTRADDTLPEILMSPLQDGGAAGVELRLGEMLEGYYAARGWDPSTGFPTAAMLQQLELEWVSDGERS